MTEPMLLLWSFACWCAGFLAALAGVKSGVITMGKDNQ